MFTTRIVVRMKPCMKAILKLWFDEVFEYQFAYGPERDKLKGNFITSFTVGADDEQYKMTGKHHLRIYEFL